MTLRPSIRMAGLASVKLSQLSNANASTRLATAKAMTRELRMRHPMYTKTNNRRKSKTMSRGPRGYSSWASMTRTEVELEVM